MQGGIRAGWPTAALVAIALAGCGSSGSKTSSDETATFKAGLSPVVNKLRETAQGMARAIQQAPSQNDAHIAESFGRIASAWQSQLSELETLKPPSTLAAYFNALSDSARRVEADLNAIIAAAHTSSTPGAEQASATLVTDILGAKAASTKLTDKLGVK